MKSIALENPDLAFDAELFGEDFLAGTVKENLDAHDVHSDTPFEVCKACSGSTAPTCKKNRKCLAMTK